MEREGIGKQEGNNYKRRRKAQKGYRGGEGERKDVEGREEGRIEGRESMLERHISFSHLQVLPVPYVSPPGSFPHNAGG